jgi:hypothetical protein
MARGDDSGGPQLSRKRRSARRVAKRRAEEWLGPGEAARERPWAYEEILLGPNGDGERQAELDALAADLAVDLADLKRLQNELYDQVVRIAGLEGRIRALQDGASEEVEGAAEDVRAAVDVRSLPSDQPLPHALREAPSLARCEGFDVLSPDGPIGYVEGLRFVSRIDEPDLLEVRGGRFGRELVLIPVEAVEEVVPEEERIVVRALPRGARDDNASSELVRVFRRALHHAE